MPARSPSAGPARSWISSGLLFWRDDEGVPSLASVWGVLLLLYEPRLPEFSNNRTTIMMLELTVTQSYMVRHHLTWGT
jgi:hypothetical protein